MDASVLPSLAMGNDLRYGLRMMRRSPGFTTVAVLTLALGIGANTAIFQLLDAVRLRLLPVKNPQELTLIQLADRKGWRGHQSSGYPALTNPIWERLRDTQTEFSGTLAWSNADFGLSRSGDSRLARGLWVSGEFFHVLGVQPLKGRVFTAADDRPGCGLPGTVISHAFWLHELGGDPAVIGKTITLGESTVEIIGVTPEGFTGVEIGRSYEMAVPICSQATLWTDGNWLKAGTVWWLTIMGRLRPGGALEKANAQLHAVSPGIFEASLPKNYPPVNVKDYLAFQLKAVPSAGGVSQLREQYEDPMWLLLASTGLVLLIACANLANLMLARSSARSREVSVRLAIGASRGRIIRQLMSESLLLAAAGGAVGLLLAGTLSEFLVSLLGGERSAIFLDLDPDWRVLVFTVAMATLTCVLFGLVPALRATRTAPAEAMNASSRSLSGSREGFGLRRALVISQVAMSLVLLFGALLFSRTLGNLMAVDAGFQKHGILIAEVDFRRLKLPPERRAAYKRDLLEKIRAVPGVDAAAQAGIIPLSGSSGSNTVWIEGGDPNRKMESKFAFVGDGYLTAMNIPLLAGRDFDTRDQPQTPSVALVNQTFARSLGLGENPVGHRFRREATPSDPERVFEIVGLVRDTKYHSLREAFLPVAFLSITQDKDPGSYDQLVIRCSAPLTGLTSRLRGAIKEVSPAIDVDYRTLEATVREGLLTERLMATLSSFFGVLAAMLAGIGLYGVMWYMVVRRTNEIGIRMTLGADRRNIIRLVLGEAGALAGIGLAAGAILAVLAGQAAQKMLFGLEPNDALTLTAATILLAAVALAASFLPARRASRLEPMAALRYE